MFSLYNQKVKIKKLNLRIETHGPDEVLAADIICNLAVQNDVLAEFHPSLKSFLYREGDANSSQQELDLKQPGDLTVLRFPNMSPFSLSDEYKGYEATIGYGIGGPSDIVLQNCDVNSFKFTPKEGGTVEIDFYVQVRPSETDMAKLCAFLKKDADITLLPPEEQQQEFRTAA